MADDADNAAELQQQQIDAALASHQSPSGTSAYWCEQCGEPIPFARREAVPGTEQCIHCAEAAERRR